MLQTPFFDPTKTYEENYSEGPFGTFANQSKVFQRTGKPSEIFLGIPVWQKFGIPAGPLLNANYVRAAFRHGFDIATYKTVRSTHYPCHEFPNVLSVKIKGNLTLKKAAKMLVSDQNYQEPLSITNSFGVPSRDPSIWQEDMREAVLSAQRGQVMIASFQGTKNEKNSVKEFIQDHVRTARLVRETGAKIFEINLSCPNEGTSDLLCFDTDRVEQIVEKVKNEIGDIPLIVKMAYFQEDEHLRDFVKRIGKMVQGMSAINTIPATIIDSEGNQALPGEGRARSGVCGAAIQWAGVEMSTRLKELRDELDLDYSIIGVGGVTSAKDVKKYQKAGADAVMSATGAMWNPNLAQEVWQLETQDQEATVGVSTFDNFVSDHNVVGFFPNPIKLVSGRMSSWYVNWRTVSEDVFLMDQLSDFVLEFVREKKIDVDCFYGTPDGATKLAVICQFKWAKSQPDYAEGKYPLAMGRKFPKEHGMPKDRFFVGAPRGKVLVMEDVTTTGGSLLKAVNNLVQAGIDVPAVLTLTNRNEVMDDGRHVSEVLKEKGVQYFAMSNALTLLPILLEKQKESIIEEFKQYGQREIDLN
jgi:dihydroorotate dehydrogenase (NAD+) catalytic subunit